jgi:hypothetical protein
MSSSRHRARRTRAILRATMRPPPADHPDVVSCRDLSHSPKNKLRCQVFDVSADRLIRAVANRLTKGAPLTTTQPRDMTIFSESDTGDLFRALEGDAMARTERVRRIKDLVDRGVYRPDLMLVASRILASARASPSKK